MKEAIAGLVVLVSLVLIPGSAFAYWVPDIDGFSPLVYLMWKIMM